MTQQQRDLPKRLAPAICAVLSLFALCSPAWAGDLAVKVTNSSGSPVSDAVVMVHLRGDRPLKPIHFPWPLVMEQRNMEFRPFVLIVPQGAEVAFPNHDAFRHHVYSFSPAKMFELKLYGHDETRKVRFDKPGVVALGCNIHDDMTAFIRVVDTPYAATTNSRGEAVIPDVPAGPAEVSVWHPYEKGADRKKEVLAPAEGTAAVAMSVEVRPAPMRHGSY